MTVMLDKVPFEDALTATGFGIFNYMIFLLSGSIIMGMGFETFSVAYLVPASACDLNTTSAQQGFMAATPLVGIIITSHIWGYLADTRGRRKILCISMVMGFVTGASATLSPNWIVFIVLKFLSSCSVAGAFALSLTLLSECTPQIQRNNMILLTTTVFLTCTGTMAAISIPILHLDFSYPIPWLGIVFCPWRLLNIIFCIPCAISAIGLYSAYESPKYLVSAGEPDKALEILKRIYLTNNRKSRDIYMVNSVVLDEQNAQKHKSLWVSIVAQTTPLLKPPIIFNFLLLSVIYIIVYICVHSYMVWLPFIADAFIRAVQNGADGMSFCDMLRSSQKNVSSVDVDLTENTCALNQLALTMVVAIAMVLAFINIFVSSIVNCIGRKTLFIAIQFIAGTAALCLNSSYTWILSAILFITFITGVLNFGVLSSFSVDVFPTYVKAMAVSLTLMVGRGSAVFGVNVLKNLLDNNCEASFYIFGSIAVCGGIIGLALPTDGKIKKQKMSIET